MRLVLLPCAALILRVLQTHLLLAETALRLLLVGVERELYRDALQCKWG
jgi:hypothetical protein